MLVAGVTVTIKVAHVLFCLSRMFFVRAYPRETQKMVFDAHDGPGAVLDAGRQSVETFVVRLSSKISARRGFDALGLISGHSDFIWRDSLKEELENVAVKSR